MKAIILSAFIVWSLAGNFEGRPYYHDVYNMKMESNYDPELLFEKRLIDYLSKRNNGALPENAKLRFLSKDVITSIETLGCKACKFLVGALHDATDTKLTDFLVSEIATFVCKYYKIETDRVCTDVIQEFKEEVVYLIKNLAVTSDEICGLILGPKCAVEPYDPFGQSWNITLPNVPKPPIKPIQEPNPTSPKTRILHLSDIHLDPDYTPGTSATCNEPLCCHKEDGPPPPGTAGAGKWGDIRGCDTPYATLENLFQHLQKEKFDYVYWTGDLPSHKVWEQSREQQLNLLKNLTSLLLKYFPDKKIYGTLGNHESAPVNSFPPPFVTGSDSISWLYDEVALSWSNWIPKEEIPNIKHGGFYSTNVEPGLRVISLNMNYCNNLNWWLLLNTTDPANELQWLMTVLQDAENKNDKVHIIGHINPGNGDCLKAWSWNYYKIVNRYEGTIAGQFFGHSHKDFFEVFYDELNHTRASNIAFVAPSVTTYTYTNPGYRIYTVDGNYKNSTRAVLDHETYILNLTEANLIDKPEWKLEYTAKADYGMKRLTPMDWDDLVNKMKNDKTLWNKFHKYYFKGVPQKTECIGKCKTNFLCQLKTGRSHDTTFCNEL